jgi:hypothetical protein
MLRKRMALGWILKKYVVRIGGNDQGSYPMAALMLAMLNLRVPRNDLEVTSYLVQRVLSSEIYRRVVR